MERGRRADVGGSGARRRHNTRLHMPNHSRPLPSLTGLGPLSLTENHGHHSTSTSNSNSGDGGSSSILRAASLSHQVIELSAEPSVHACIHAAIHPLDCATTLSAKTVLIESWRQSFDEEHTVLSVNNGNDFIIMFALPFRHSHACPYIDRSLVALSSSLRLSSLS